MGRERLMYYFLIQFDPHIDVFHYYDDPEEIEELLGKMRSA